MIVNTTSGNISVKEVNDPNFRGVLITIDGDEAKSVLVEFDSLKDLFQVHIWDQEEEPIVTHQFK